ncbi:efflux RND transporter periplasmic adaptor subunit [Sphingobacterium sp. UT-1RO-CII-1]|uniref:efflux RND transporter periplasmic adaptor subunit n=1 Tax=Sphingobacterium sp. UT-1RO-CII-1 TaxID=2995225 RepID=UPI00227AC620|nr:efflux RND transporter periplasmic adaptor subunit [Sphingobacterium sp. UT-1RO-CII-1]MCY4778310.1 efflux RND transporter periplasmic adaptor subunit [Sphingobacterium sp. UT-1RO-CII-1]
MILRKSYKKHWTCAAILMLLIAACQSTHKEQEEEETHVQTILPENEKQVKTTVLKNEAFSHELVSNGTIGAQQKADLYFESPDILEAIYVKNGQQVVKGQKIAMLTQFKLQSALRQAFDNVEKAKLELQDVLISQGYVLRDSLKIPPETLRIAKIKSNYENSLIQLEMAEFNLKNSVLYAPHDGVIANLFVKTYNMPTSGQPFCTLIGTHSLDTDFLVLESELPFVRPGDNVEITPFSLNINFVGKIIEINPVVDEQGMVKVKARIQNPSNHLYEGMNVKVRVKHEAGNQLVVPKSAVVLRSNKKVVFTAKAGKALWNYVETGHENSTSYTITEGLKAGDSVIYTGNINLAHEAPVVVINDIK